MTSPVSGSQQVDDDLQEIKRRCELSGIQYKVGIERFEDEDDYSNAPPVLYIKFPDGESTRDLLLPKEEFAGFRSIAFEDYSFLPGYYAILDSNTGNIEASIRSEASTFFGSRALRRIAALGTPSGRDTTEGDGGSTSDRGDMPGSSDWISNDKDLRISARRDGLVIELSTPTTEFLRIIRRRQGGLTLKLSGLNLKDLNETRQAFLTIINSFLFELDVRHDVLLTLAGYSRGASGGAMKPPKNVMPLRFPEFTYPLEPVQLYQYGRAAHRLPLLEFLAYYQVIEYFFPVYSRQEAVRKLRVALKQPKFDIEDDISLIRLLGQLFPEGRTTISEREQLRTTIRSCIDTETILELIESSPRYKRHFTSKEQAITGAGRILLHDGHTDVRDQIANRIYGIRCRVVHTKNDDASVDLLLPSSPEARQLGPDVQLMRLVAQHVLGAAGQQLRL